MNVKDPHPISNDPVLYGLKNKNKFLKHFFKSNERNYIKLKATIHSALKLGKKCNFKSTKKHHLHFQKWQKINFCTRKKFRTTKNAIFGLKKKQDFW